MTFTAIFLIIGSAVIHATWNFLCKKTSSSGAFFLVASIPGCIILLPLIFCSFGMIKVFPIEIWVFLAITGIFQALYYVSLSRAYKHGEMSIAYPVARVLPVVFVTIIVYIISKGTQSLSHTSTLGAIFIIIGCIILPMKHLKDMRIRNYTNISCLFAIIAAIGTTGYSIIDDHSIDMLKIFFQKSENIATLSLIYIFFETVTSFLWLGIYVFSVKDERLELHRTLRENKKASITAGIGITVAYAMVLMAMAFSNNVSYVVGFRQLGVFIGAMFGILFLHEKISLPKILGMSIVLVGLILLATGS